MVKIIQEEVDKTSQELIDDLARAKILGETTEPQLARGVRDIVVKRVEEKFEDYRKDLELGQHVHAIFKFFKGVI